MEDRPTRASRRQRSTKTISPRSSACGPAFPCTHAHRRRVQEAAAHGRRAAQPPHRPGRGRARGRQGHPPLARRPQRPPAADRLVHLPGPVRRGQDRARPRAGRVPVRRRRHARAARHERVHGEALRVAPGRLAARLRGLRRGRPAHRGRPPQALRVVLLRRDRKGAPRRLQHPAADLGRRAPDRRPGPHGRLQQHHRHHDQQRRRRHDPQDTRWASARPTPWASATTT